MSAFVKIFDENGLPLGFAPFESGVGKEMAISPSLPADVEGTTTSSPLVITISNVKAEPTSLKIGGGFGSGSFEDFEIYGKEDGSDIHYGAWTLVKAPVYANGEVTFSLADEHANGSLQKVEITARGKTTTFQ